MPTNFKIIATELLAEYSNDNFQMISHKTNASGQIANGIIEDKVQDLKCNFNLLLYNRPGEARAVLKTAL